MNVSHATRWLPSSNDSRNGLRPAVELAPLGGRSEATGGPWYIRAMRSVPFFFGYFWFSPTPGGETSA